MKLNSMKIISLNSLTVYKTGIEIFGTSRDLSLQLIPILPKIQSAYCGRY
jgi:hypothetical protein